MKTLKNKLWYFIPFSIFIASMFGIISPFMVDYTRLGYELEVAIDLHYLICVFGVFSSILLWVVISMYHVIEKLLKTLSIRQNQSEQNLGQYFKIKDKCHETSMELLRVKLTNSTLKLVNDMNKIELDELTAKNKELTEGFHSQKRIAASWKANFEQMQVRYNELKPKTKAKSLSVDDHKQRHIDMHKSFDELFADYIRHNMEEINFLDIPLKKLLDWSFNQTINPTNNVPCGSFDPDTTTSSATKCKCGCEKSEHIN